MRFGQAFQADFEATLRVEIEPQRARTATWVQDVVFDPMAKRYRCLDIWRIRERRQQFEDTFLAEKGTFEVQNLTKCLADKQHTEIPIKDDAAVEIGPDPLDGGKLRRHRGVSRHILGAG